MKRVVLFFCYITDLRTGDLMQQLTLLNSPLLLQMRDVLSQLDAVAHLTAGVWDFLPENVLQFNEILFTALEYLHQSVYLVNPKLKISFSLVSPPILASFRSLDSWDIHYFDLNVVVS